MAQNLRSAGNRKSSVRNVSRIDYKRVNSIEGVHCTSRRADLSADPRVSPPAWAAVLSYGYNTLEETYAKKNNLISAAELNYNLRER